MNLSLFAAEIGVGLLALGLLILSLAAGRRAAKLLLPLSVLGLFLLLAITGMQYGLNTNAFQGSWRIDDYAVFAKQIFIVAAIMVFLAAEISVAAFSGNHSEFYVLMLFALLGMFGMASANDLITLYVSLETMTISFYILVAYGVTDGKSPEAGLKYLILGALSSAVLLFGMSMVYGSAGTTLLSGIASAKPDILLVFGSLLMLAGFAFKITLAPFHMWAPDVYEGAPTPVTAFLAAASKAAGFVALLRVFLGGLPLSDGTWFLSLAILAAITMVWGNLAALPQTSIKRMLAYSSVAQAGYILVGMLADSSDGVNGVLFYMMIYTIANTGAFVVAMTVEKATGSDAIANFAGLWKRAPLLGTVMTICLLSLAGIPPMAGFAGKFLLFSSIMDKGIYWPAFLGFIMSMISVYYYLKVALVIWRDDPASLPPVVTDWKVQWVALLALGLTLLFGIYPAALLDVSFTAAKALFLH